MKILTAALVLGLAGTAVAKDPSGATLMSSANGLNGQVVNPQTSGIAGVRYTAVYDFASGSLDYFAGSLPGGTLTFDPAGANLRILGMEFSNIETEVNWNVGATFENWASELRLGWDDANFGIIGIAPYPGVNDGPLSPGTSQLFTGGNLPFFDLDGTVDIDGDTIPDDFFMPASGAAVGAFSTYNDGSGQPAGTIVGGTITFYLVPAPGAAALFAMGGLAAIRRRR